MAGKAKNLLYGTLDLLILKAVSAGPLHGYGIGQWLESVSDERIRVDESSLYPALYRLREKGLLEAEWGRSELDRRAKFYRLTPAGRERLSRESGDWSEFARAVATVLAADAPGSPAGDEV
jgi:transcriptional regulator